MHARLKKLFEIKGYRLLVICMLMIGIGISITTPYLALYFTEDLGMTTGAFGVFMAVSSLSGILVNTLIAKRPMRSRPKMDIDCSNAFVCFGVCCVFDIR